MEISIKLLAMWQKAQIWDHILSRPVHGNFHRSASDVFKSLNMGSYISYLGLFMEISIKLFVVWQKA